MSELRSIAQVDLKALLSGDATLPLPAESAAPGAAESLQLLLAVRGWTKPGALTDTTLTAGLASSALAAVASDVETAAATRPGEWFLAAPARRESIAKVGDRDLLEACRPLVDGDLEDPIRRAFHQAIGTARVELENLDEPLLGALVNVHDWLGERWRLPFGPEQVNAEIAARTLDADLARMTALPLVGKIHQQALKELTAFAGGPAKSPLSAIYIHATGGGGKTTLLAFLQRDLQTSARPVAVSRIDFDEPAIDPARMVTLNLALFEQLAGGVPALRERIGYYLPALRLTASALRASEAVDHPLAGSPGRRVKGPQSLVAQSYRSESVSDQSSILFGLLAPATLGGPLVIVLDTAELVLTQNHRAAAGIADWLEFLQTEAHAGDIRLIIAGRDPPPAAPDGDDLLSRLARIGAQFLPPIALPELNADEAETLLANCEVDDPKLRRAAAAAVPGNPLLLRITADALKQGDAKLVRSIHAAHDKAQVDKQSAHTYLMRRIVAHVGDPQARPYVLAAMASPVLTAAILGQVIIPAVDEGESDEAGRSPQARKVRRVFRSLAATVWLGRLSLDGKSIALNRDLRGFVLKLVAAAPEDAARHRRMHEALLAYHEPRKSARDRALAIYHAAALGRPYRAPASEPVRRHLREVFDELPEALQEQISEAPPAKKRPRVAAAAGTARGRSSANAQSAVSDTDWRLYLEGDGKRRGQGENLVEDDRAREALALYRERPTRGHGRPPTFVIQALADLGMWDGREVDVAAMVAELEDLTDFETNRGRISPDALSRLYWLTRYALLKDNGALTGYQLHLLRAVSQRLIGPGLTMLPALMAVAEAVSGRTLIDPRMVSRLDGDEGHRRILLARREGAKVELPVSQIAVTQRDWMKRIEATRCVREFGSLAWAQRSIDSLAGRPIAAVNQTFAEMRRRVPVTWDGSDMPGGVLLLRGQTTEFLRPLRETLADLYEAKGEGALRDIVAPVLHRMSIRPKEMEEAAFFERVRANPRPWFTAFVSYADRSRLLPGLCRAVVARKDPGKVGKAAARVAKSYLAWDRALCSGWGSDWHETRYPRRA